MQCRVATIMQCMAAAYPMHMEDIGVFRMNTTEGRRKEKEIDSRNARKASSQSLIACWSRFIRYTHSHTALKQQRDHLEFEWKPFAPVLNIEHIMVVFSGVCGWTPGGILLYLERNILYCQYFQ